MIKLSEILTGQVVGNHYSDADAMTRICKFLNQDEPHEDRIKAMSRMSDFTGGSHDRADLERDIRMWDELNRASAK